MKSAGGLHVARVVDNTGLREWGKYLRSLA